MLWLPCNRACKGIHRRRGELAPGQLVDRLGPILLQQSRQRAIGEQLSVRLTARTIIGLVVGVANALHRRTADGAWLTKLSVDRHLVAECGDFCGEGPS